MKAKQTSDRTALAGKAMRRAAHGVLSKAVRDNEPVPLWDGTKVVWKVPRQEVEEMEAQDSQESDH
jgi:hypothetical protein